jgi:amino acid transporter
MAAAQKANRGSSSAQVRQAMRTGDERYLPPRDKGPVRRFIRDSVDSHFSLIELMIPLMLVVLVLGYTGSTAVTTYANLAMLSVFVLIIIDVVRLRFRIRRELATRFPTASTQGTTYYAVARSLQMRFMRLPKPKVKVGQSLPDSYR